MNPPGVYTITSRKTSKVYVGSSVGTATRWRVHQRDLRMGGHTNLHLQRHVDKHGLEDLVFEVVRVEPNPTRRLGYEELLIAGLFGPACFNQATSAKAPMTGRKHSPETLAKMSATAKGRPFSEAARAKALATNTGRVHTPEQRAKAVSKGFQGHTHTPETKSKIAAAYKLRLDSRATKPPSTTV
jgi:group I intron endonuclease